LTVCGAGSTRRTSCAATSRLRRQTAVQVKGRGLEAGRVACPSLAAVVNRKPRGPVMSDGPKWWRPADCLWDGDYRQAWEPKRVA
jgi:hypothetical protein